MAGTNILVRQKDLIAGSGISITPDTTSGNVTIAATNTAIDESRLLPTGGRNGNLLEYQEGVDRGNDVNTKLLIQPATSDGQIIDSAYGNEAPVGISQGTSNSPVTVENGESLAFSGSSAYLTIAEEDAAKIITGTNEWCFDVLITPEWSSGSAGVFHLGGGNYSIYINPSTGNSWIWSLSESGTIGLFANETHLLTLEQWLDGSTWKLSWYCDGVPKRTESFQYPVPDKAIRIGRGNDNDGYFQGKMNNIRFRTVADHRGASFAMPPFPFLPPAGQPVWAEGIDRSRLLKVPTSADEGKLPVIRADKIPAVYHDTTLAAIVIEGDKVIDKISGKELTKVGSPQIIDGGIHSPTNSDYYMLELEGVEGLPVAVSFDYQGDESPDSSNIVTINGNCAYYSLNGVSFCRSQGGGNNIKIDNQPVGVSEAYRNYVMQVSSDNYESKMPPVAFIAGESKSPTYEGSFPSMSPLSSVKVCGRFGKIKNILISSAFPYTGNFTPRGDGVEGFGVPEKREPGWNYETLDEAANGRLLPANPANGDIPCFDATATIGGGNDETVKFLLQPATTDGELIDSAAGAVTPATITNHSLTVSESGEIEFSSSKYATVPASGILADVLRHDKPWVFDLLVYLDQTSSQSRFFGTESGGDFFCQWTGDYGFDFKYGDTWISTLTGNVGEWNLLTLEYYQKNGTWHVALYLQGVLCQDKEISTSFDPKTSELAIGRSTSGSHLCSGKIRAIRIREGALYNGQSFTPDEFPYREPQTVGEWSKLNKSELVKSVNGQTPDADGNINLTEISEDDFSGIGYNKVPKQKPEGLILPNEFKRLKFEFSNNIPLASISAENCFPFIMANATDSDEYMAICPADPAQPNWFTFRTDGFMIKLIKLNVRIDKGSVDVVFDYELYGSLDAAAVYDGISEGWDLLHSGEAYIIAQSDNTKKLIIEIPEASRKYYRSYTFKMSSVSGPGIIEWSPQYMLHGWGSASPVESVNGQIPDGSGAVTLPVATTSTAGLMAAADKVKLNKFNGYGVPAKRIITTTDLDTLKEPGAYALYGNAVYSNIPEGETAGWLFVEATEAGAEQIRQEFVPMVVNLERRYVRRYNTNTNIWTDWVHNYFAMSALDPIDFNQLTDVGVYFINGSAEHMNYPGITANIGGILTVQGIGAYRTQSFAAISSVNQSVTWTRWATSDGSSWLFQNWRKHLIDLDIMESKVTPGYFRLPNGTIVQWGIYAITTNPQTQEITLPVAISTIYTRQASCSNTDLKVAIYGFENSKITCVSNGSDKGDVNWLVIGR